MVTPKIYTANLIKGIITDEMLASAIYSVNKRAKNARDKEREYRREYRNRYDYYGNEERARERKEYYYELKDSLLEFATAKCTCIHKVGHVKYNRRRVYDYEEEYEDIPDEEVVWSNCYYDRDWATEVYFVDVKDGLYTEYEYFLFYDFGSYSFHHPIDSSELTKYGKEIVEIDSLETEGEDETKLMSLNFVKNVLDILNNKKK